MNSPKEIAQNYIATGITKAKTSSSKLLLLGILAGMFIALAGVGATIAPVSINSPSLGKLIGALVFPAGLAMVLLSGSELFTGNNLIIIPVLEKEVKVSAMLRNWFFVYLGNFIGSILIALLAVYGGTFSAFGNAAAGAVINAAVAKVNLSPLDAIFRGIMCNFLVCIAVWMSYAAKDVVGKVAALFFPIMLFVVSGYEHSIANMYYITAGIFASRNPSYLAAATSGNYSSLNFVTLFSKNLIPVTIGNIIGGMVLVGLGYWLIYLREPQRRTLASSGKNKK